MLFLECSDNLLELSVAIALLKRKLSVCVYMMDGLVDLCICGLFATYECFKWKHTFLLFHTILIILSCKACDVSKHHNYWKHDNIIIHVILIVVILIVVDCHGWHVICKMLLLLDCDVVMLCQPIFCYQCSVPCCEENFSWQIFLVLILQ